MKIRNLYFVVGFVLGVVLTQAAAPAARADTYKVDPIHSSILFRVKHLGVGYIYGRFNDCGGTFTFDEKNPAGSSFAVEVKATTLDTNNAARDLHLKGPDFFNVKEFPTIAFKSTQVKQLDGQNYEAAGNLTLLGVTKPVTVKLERVGSGKDPRGTFRTGFESIFTIKRADFGMKFMSGAIGDEVRIIVAIEGTK